MLDRIIYFSIRNKYIIGLFTLVLIVVGLFSLSRLPMDALPDITNNQVQVITTAPTLAAQEIEQFITYPIEQAIKTVPNITELRSFSRFGLSVITVVFEEHIDIYWARQQLSDRLKAAEHDIPQGVGIPELAPISTGLGEIYQYVVFAKAGFEDQFDASKLRSVQDWIVKPQLLGTKGVAEVTTLGGSLKQYEIAVQPDKLKSMNTTITEIFDAVERNNENTGGAYIDKQPYVYLIRALGMVKNIADIEKIVVKNVNGIPILIRDVATVQEGAALRYGAVTKDGKGEVVGGMVLMLKGENSAAVVQRVKEKVAQIRESLPEGVSMEPFIDRSKLVNKAMNTVETNLIEGALIVIFILVLLIGNWRASLIVASVIPLSLLFAVTLMNLFGVSGNLMSLGAIDFGLIVDGAVIIVEAIMHRLFLHEAGRLSKIQMDSLVRKEASKLMSSAAFGQLIILIVYLPILALVGTEGKMFKPMAQTVAFAILGAGILSLTYVPMMAALFLSRTVAHKKTISDRIVAFLQGFYIPLLTFAFRFKILVISASVAFFILALFAFGQMGGEFIPTLEEGDYAINFRNAPGSSLNQSIATSTKLETILKKQFPEVIEVVSKIGSAEIPTDPMPIETGDLIVILKDKKEWTTTKDFYELAEKMKTAMEEIPGVGFELSQPIQMRFNELMTGVRSDVAIKIFGEDLDKLSALANNAIGMIGNIPGIADIKAEQVTGLPQITIRYNPDKMALYGLNVGDLNKVVRTGFAGEVSGVVYEGERRYDLVVRLARDARQDIADVKNLFISLPTGNQIPLEQVADIDYELGPAQISREDGRRRIVIGLNVRGSDVKSVVGEIQNRLDAKLKLPEGYYITYGGQFENLIAANKRLSVAVPIALSLILILLFFTFNSIKHTLLIFTAIPLSAIGGVFGLWFRGMPFSISAGIGFIALFGVAVLNGIVLIGYFNQLKAEGWDDTWERIKEGTKVRLRPVIMTAAVASLGFLPMALSTGAGAEVQKPLATVVIGGLITATLLTLIVLPILYFLFEKGIRRHRVSGMTVVAILMLSLPFSTSKAQSIQRLTLEDAVEMALKNNGAIQAGQLEVQLQNQLRRAPAELPKMSIDGIFGQINSPEFDENLSISQEIPNPLALRSKRQLAAENVRSSELKLNAAQQKLIYDLRQSWNTLLFLMASNTLLQKQDTVLQAFSKGASLRLKTGEASNLEFLLANTKWQEHRQMIFQNEALIRAEQIKIKAFLGLQTDFSVAETAFVPQTLMADTNLIHQNPVLLLAIQQVQVAMAQKKVEKTAALPDFSAGYFIQSFTGKQEVDGQPVYYNAVPRFQGISAGIRLPLLGMKYYKAKVAAAETEIELQQLNADYLQSQLQSQLQYQLTSYYAGQSQIAYYNETALPNAAAIETGAGKSYQSGDISYLEYLQAVQTALEIQKNYLQTVHTFNQEGIHILFLLNQ